MAPPLNNNTRTRVLLLTQWFEPEPTFKGLGFARALRDEGLDVEVVTGFPNYPGGKLYAGYRVQGWQREVMDGISVTRLPLYPSHDGRALPRVVNYLSFFASATLFGLLRWRKPQVIYAYHPPLTVGLAAAVVGWLRRVPVVLDIQDMWPDTLRATGMLSNERILRVVASVCRWVYARVTRVVVLSPGFARLLVQRGVPAHKVEVIPNWCEESALAAPVGRLADGFPGPERFRILFAGNMGRAQALDAVLDAAALTLAQAPLVTWVFMGGGIETARLREQAAARGLSNVVFLPAVPMAEVGHALAAADVLLVHLRRDPLFAITIPSKTQAYMAMGRPLIMAVQGDAADLVRQAGCGLVAEPEDPQSLAAAALQLAALPAAERDQMGERGARHYSERMSLRAGSGRFAQIFRALAAGRALNLTELDRPC
jgi:colanic acid biosynthesis glycosyl transferase WcaI